MTAFAKRYFQASFLKDDGTIWRICGFEEMLRICRLKGKDKAKVNVLYISRFVWTAEEFINLFKIRYKIPGGQMTTSPCPWEPGNLGKSICLKSAIRNHEKQKIKLILKDKTWEPGNLGEIDSKSNWCKIWNYIWLTSNVKTYEWERM